MKKVRRVYQTGQLREVRDVYVQDKYIPRGPRKKGNARRSQMDANMKTAIREANRIITANFRYERGDILATLSFEQEPESREAAWALCSKKLDKLRRMAKKNGQALRFFAVVSDMDGETKETVRIHIHACLGGVTMEQVRQAWDLGVADCRSIRKEYSHERLAVYLLTQCRCKPDEKKWHTSRNLERTQLISETEVQGTSRYHMPKGGKEIWRGEYAPDQGKLLDVQIWMPAPETAAQPKQPKPAAAARAGGRVKNNKGEKGKKKEAGTHDQAGK